MGTYTKFGKNGEYRFRWFGRVVRRDDLDAFLFALYTIQHIKYINISLYLVLNIMNFVHFLLIILCIGD